MQFASLYKNIPEDLIIIYYRTEMYPGGPPPPHFNPRYSPYPNKTQLASCHIIRSHSRLSLQTMELLQRPRPDFLSQSFETGRDVATRMFENITPLNLPPSSFSS